MPRKKTPDPAPKPKPARILRMRFRGSEPLKARLDDGRHWTWRPGALIVVDSVTWEAVRVLPDVAKAIAARLIVE